MTTQPERCTVHSSVTALTAVLFVLFGLAGCGESASQSNDNDATVINTDDMGQDISFFTCLADDNCEGGEVCLSGVCRESCNTDDPCEGALSTCDSDENICVECLDDEGCGENQRCTEGLCEAIDRCDDNNDCEDDLWCDDGECVPVIPDSCTTPGVRCVDGVAVSCNDAGTENRQTCTENQVCVTDQGCEDVLCEPNATGCLDEDTAFYCDGSGRELTELPCRDGQICDDGVCENLLCAPGEVVCQGNTLIECTEDGEPEATPCADFEDCDESEFGCACVEDDCVARVCLPDSGRCVGNSVQACTDDGMSYLDPVPCEGEDICVAGSCLPPTCEPGDSFCSGDILLTCNELGTGYVDDDCIEHNQFCRPFADGAECILQVCEPNSAECDGDRVALVCNSNGSEEMVIVCDSDEICDGGACLLKVCDPDDPPICLEGNVSVCRADGGGYVLDEECDSACIDGECEEGLNILAQLSWESENADLDIHMVREGGTWSSSDDCYFANKNPDWGAPGLADNPSLDLDALRAPGPENISLYSTETNRYIIGVENYGGSAGSIGLPADARLRIYLNSELRLDINADEFLTRSFWTVAAVSAPSGAIEVIDEITDSVPGGTNTTEDCSNSIDDDGDDLVDCDDPDCTFACNETDCFTQCLSDPDPATCIFACLAGGGGAEDCDNEIDDDGDDAIDCADSDCFLDPACFG